MMPKALGTVSSGTRRITVAVESDQNPPTTTPRRARAIISTRKFGATAMRISDASMTPVSPNSTCRRLYRPATVAISKLATTANSPEIEIACPAIPSVARRSRAIGVNKLTGINSAAISMLTQSAIDPTALHVCRGESSFFFIWSFHLVLAKGARGPQEIFCRGEIDRLLQIFSEKGREFIEWDEFHPVIKVNVTGAWNDDQFFGLTGQLV